MDKDLPVADDNFDVNNIEMLIDGKINPVASIPEEDDPDDVSTSDAPPLPELTLSEKKILLDMMTRWITEDVNISKWASSDDISAVYRMKNDFENYLSKTSTQSSILNFLTKTVPQQGSSSGSSSSNSK